MAVLLLVFRGTGGARGGDASDARTVLFGSLDAGGSSFVQAGAKHALDAPGTNGFVGLASLGYGIRVERQGDATPKQVVRHTVKAGLVGGWQWFDEWGVVALFAGPELDLERLEGAARAPGPVAGLRLHGEVWARPDQDSLVTATLIAGSARRDLWGRVSYGRRFLGAYVGPEAALYADSAGYRKWSLGAHATDFSLGAVALRVSAGWLHEERERRSGLYGALTLWRPW